MMKQRKTARKTGTSKRSARAAGGRKAARRKAVAAPPPGILALPPDCLIASAGDMKSDLLRLAEIETPVTIDASFVQRIDTACFQVLAAFARGRRAAGRPLAWTGVPDAITDSASLLNLTEELGIDAPPGDRMPA
jgi:anti-anti-sigma regulatory factor